MTDGEAHQSQLVMTLGISLVLANGGLMVFGATPASINLPLSWQAWTSGNDSLLVFFNEAQVIGPVVALVATAALYFLLQRSDMGRRLRAAADNPLAATYMGIDVLRAHHTTFGLGFALTAIAGAVVATYYPFQPYVGLDFIIIIIIMYAGVMLRGLGSITGSFWSGLIIGLVQQISSLFLPLQLQGTTVFVVFLIILLPVLRGSSDATRNGCEEMFVGNRKANYVAMVLSPPKAEVVSSNLAGCAIYFNGLRELRRFKSSI